MARIVLYRGRRSLDHITRRRMARRVAAATNEVYKTAVLLVNTPTRSAGPSKVGEPPHKDTGDLQRRIFAQPVRMTPKGASAKVATNLDYGVFWETTVRPYIRPALLKAWPRVKRVLTRRDTGLTARIQ